PAFCTATFLGYLVAGGPGAAAATVGIFLPAFLLVGLTHSRVAKIRASPLASGFLDGVNAAAVALMAAVFLELGRAALWAHPPVAAWPGWSIFAGALVLLWRTRVNSAWIVLGGALAGAALPTIR